jgi:hypothetical protein
VKILNNWNVQLKMTNDDCSSDLSGEDFRTKLSQIVALTVIFVFSRSKVPYPFPSALSLPFNLARGLTVFYCDTFIKKR